MGAMQKHDQVFAKVARRLIPFMVALYTVAFLDRVNIGFAGPTMNQDLNFSPEVFGWGAGIFFVGYFLFEVPSNVILEKVGARVWIARIMITWGIVSGAMAFVRTRQLRRHAVSPRLRSRRAARIGPLVSACAVKSQPRPG